MKSPIWLEAIAGAASIGWRPSLVGTLRIRARTQRHRVSRLNQMVTTKPPGTNVPCNGFGRFVRPVWCPGRCVKTVGASNCLLGDKVELPTCHVCLFISKTSPRLAYMLLLVLEAPGFSDSVAEWFCPGRLSRPRWVPASISKVGWVEKVPPTTL